MFITDNKFFFIEKIRNFFNGYDNTKLDEMSIFCLKIFHKEVTVSATVKKIALRHLFYLFKEESDKTFPFTYNTKAVKKFKEYEKLMKENRNVSFEKEILLLAGFLFGWVRKNDKNQFMIKRILDLTNCSKSKEIFWSFIMIWASINLFEKKEANVIIGGTNKKQNLYIFRKILNYVDTIPKIRKNFFKIENDMILSSKLGKIKIDNIENHLENSNNSKFIYVNDFYESYNNDLMLKLEKSNLNNALIVYDGSHNQNIEAKSSYLNLKYKYKLEEQTSNLNLNYSEYETLLWEPNVDTNSEHFCENSQKSTLYYSLLKKSNESIKKNIIEKIKKDFYKENAVIGIEWDSENQIAISLMFSVKYKTHKKALVFKNIYIITEHFKEKRNKYPKKVYEKWISEKTIVVAGEEIFKFNIIEQIFKLLKEKYNIVNVVFNGFNKSSKTLVNFLIKKNIFSKNIVTRIEKDTEIWENFQIFNGKIFNKEVFIYDEDFIFRQFLNFCSVEKDRKWYIRRISNTFPWGNLLSSLLCISKRNLLVNNDLEKCICLKS